MAELETIPIPMGASRTCRETFDEPDTLDDACTRHRSSPGRNEKQGRIELVACRLPLAATDRFATCI